MESMRGLLKINFAPKAGADVSTSPQIAQIRQKVGTQKSGLEGRLCADTG
jgi:hypothetical protein